MKNRSIKLDKFGISTAAYTELRGFCLQYNEKKAKINDALSQKSPGLSGMPHGTGISDPTAKAAETIDKYKKDVEIIEQAAAETDEKNAEFIILNVTTDKCPVWVLKTRYGMTMGEGQFNVKRRQFYYLLAKKKQII